MIKQFTKNKYDGHEPTTTTDLNTPKCGQTPVEYGIVDHVCSAPLPLTWDYNVTVILLRFITGNFYDKRKFYKARQNDNTIKIRNQLSNTPFRKYNINFLIA